MGRQNIRKPVIALTMGDISGIGPEIVARVLSEDAPSYCHLVVVGDIGLLDVAAARLGVPPLSASLVTWNTAQATAGGTSFVACCHAPQDLLAVGRPEPQAGEAAAKALVAAIELAAHQPIDAVVFAPLCKEVLRYEGRLYGDEIFLMREAAHCPDITRAVIVNDVLTTSVTGHVALREVPGLVTQERVLHAITFLHETVSLCGLGTARLAVAALNPHGGEHGMFGDEESRQIVPAIKAAQAMGIPVSGPFPADTVFMRAFRGEFNGVVSMYHDQANIASKLTHLASRVVLYVRGPVLLATPGHGTAFDIAGKGIADANGLRTAIRMVARIARAANG